VNVNTSNIQVYGLETTNHPGRSLMTRARMWVACACIKELTAAAVIWGDIAALICQCSWASRV
jgi:hypothetical protein